MKSFGQYLLTKGLKIIASINSSDVRDIVKYVISVSSQDIENYEKLEKVITYANDHFVAKSNQWITTALIEVLYAVAKRKGLLED